MILWILSICHFYQCMHLLSVYQNFKCMFSMLLGLFLFLYDLVEMKEPLPKIMMHFLGQSLPLRLCCQCCSNCSHTSCGLDKVSPLGHTFLTCLKIHLIIHACYLSLFYIWDIIIKSYCPIKSFPMLTCCSHIKVLISLA